VNGWDSVYQRGMIQLHMAALPQPSRIRLLLADDHPIMRDGLKFMLAQNEDITVVCEAANGVEAVDMFAAHRPNVVLIDLQMPRMEGLEAISRIRKMDPNVAIVVLTTFAAIFVPRAH
jgi:two-component system NarL family response regulator